MHMKMHIFVMKKHLFFLAVVLCVLFTCLVILFNNKCNFFVDRKPNIILIITDDQDVILQGMVSLCQISQSSSGLIGKAPSCVPNALAMAEADRKIGLGAKMQIVLIFENLPDFSSLWNSDCFKPNLS